jgi:hypothetical protein
MDNHMHATGWRKSTHSNGSGDCIEVGHTPGRIAIRDTKDHGNGPVLHLHPADWRRLTTAIRNS